MANCLHSAIPSTITPASNIVEEVDLSKVLPCYHDIKTVFCKVKTNALPPHRPYGCSIELLNVAALPKGKLFYLSSLEKSAMENYIQEALSSGHTRPSS